MEKCGDTQSVHRYINDIIKAPKYGEIVLFADDTGIIIKAKSIDEAMTKTNIDLNEIGKWLKQNKLIINAKKTKLMMVNKNKNEPFTQNTLKIDDEAIEKVESIKYLGVQIDNRLNFEEHIQTCTNNLAKKYRMNVSHIVLKQ